MSFSLKQEYEWLGIDINLTKQGAEVLTKILSEGCPVKFDSHYPIPINCPLHMRGGLQTCQSCWRLYLKNFIKKG